MRRQASSKEYCAIDGVIYWGLGLVFALLAGMASGRLASRIERRLTTCKHETQAAVSEKGSGSFSTAWR